MNKPSKNPELIDARRQLSAGPEALVELRPLPAVAVQISQRCRSQEVDTRALAKLVSGDPAFALKILRVVNSSLYGFSREVTTIEQALVVLGRKAIAQLALSVASQQVFSKGEAAQEARKKLFLHSLGCASVARSLIEHQSLEVDPGEIFLAGIVHDIGKLVFLDLAPVSYGEVVESNELFCSVEMEQSMFGTDHTKLGEMFSHSWELSNSIANAVCHHHSDDFDSLPLLTQTITIANELTKFWGIGQGKTPIPDGPATSWLESQQTLIEEVQRSATEHYYEAKALLLG